MFAIAFFTTSLLQFELAFENGIDMISCLLLNQLRQQNANPSIFLAFTAGNGTHRTSHEFLTIAAVPYKDYEIQVRAVSGQMKGELLQYDGDVQTDETSKCTVD